MAVSGSPLQFNFPCRLRGYHKHRFWTPKIGEALSASIEKDNVADPNAIALKIQFARDMRPRVGYLPREISKYTADVIRQGGNVMCKVTDAQIRLGKGQEVPIQVIVTIYGSE